MIGFSAMSGNTFGKIFKITTFGESHGEALGVIIDGCPSGIEIDLERLQSALDRRKPGQTSPDGKLSSSVTSRKEPDKAEILSGVFEGVSTGCPIAIAVKNTSQKSGDYSNIMNKFRPGHADFTFYQKYGIRDYRGGGRSSGRETLARVAGGEIARMVLENYLPSIKITASTVEVAGIKATEYDESQIEKNSVRCADEKSAILMEEKIAEYRKQGESCGGIVECKISGMIAGLGEPVFDKLDAELAKTMLSIGAVKGIEFGSGFESARMTGSSWNDNMRIKDGKPSFETNHAGGILGGISNGNDIIFRIAIKPVPSIFKKQNTIDIFDNETEILIEGRHDICLCPRIIPVVEAMSAITLLDLFLQNKCSNFYKEEGISKL